MTHPAEKESVVEGLSENRIRAIANECGMFDDAYENEPGAFCDRFARAIESEVRRTYAASLASQGVPQPSAQGPEELWLQLHGDCSDAELDEPVDYTGGDVTWCWHRINDSDVRYVRADLAASPSPVASQAAPVGWLYDWTHSSALGKPDEHFTGFTTDEAYARKHDNARPVIAASPSPVAAGWQDIATVPRYVATDSPEIMQPSPIGAWVRWDDVRRLMASPPPSSTPNDQQEKKHG